MSKSNEKGQVYRDWRTRIPYKIVEKYEKETLKSKVEYILSTIPETRNDDTLLALQVWHSLRSDLFLSLEGREGLYIRAKDLLDHLPNHDHISRIRRKFQEEVNIHRPIQRLLDRGRNLKMNGEAFMTA